MNQEIIEKNWQETLKLMKEADPKTINSVSETHIRIWKEMYKTWFEDGVIESNKIHLNTSMNTKKETIRV